MDLFLAIPKGTVRLHQLTSCAPSLRAICAESMAALPPPQLELCLMCVIARYEERQGTNDHFRALEPRFRFEGSCALRKQDAYFYVLGGGDLL